MKRAVALVILILVSVPALAIAQNSSPYVVGQWNLQDNFKDFKGTAPVIITDNHGVYVHQSDPFDFDLGVRVLRVRWHLLRV